MISEKQILTLIKNKFSKKIMDHSIGVAETAEQLAKSEGVSIKNARIAGLVHDYAKEIDQEKLKKIAASSCWHIDSIEYSIQEILHAPVGAYLIKKELEIEDQEILEAVRYHTTGSPEMGIIAQIIFLADKIEPGRSYPGVEKLRKLVKEDFKQGLIKTCDYSIKYQINKEKIIHPGTLLLRNYLLKGDKDNGQVF